MAQIQPVVFPIVGTAVELNVTVQSFPTSTNTCGTYYELVTDDGKTCITGSYYLSPEQFAGWGQDNSYIDNLIAEYLGVVIVNPAI